MKHLKKFNESSSIEDIVTEIKDMLLEVSDMGFGVEVSQVGQTIHIGVLKRGHFDLIVLDGEVESCLQRIMLHFDLEKLRIAYIGVRGFGEDAVWFWRGGRIAFIPIRYVTSPDIAQQAAERKLRKEGVFQLRVTIPIKDFKV